MAKMTMVHEHDFDIFDSEQRRFDINYCATRPKVCIINHNPRQILREKV